MLSAIETSNDSFAALPYVTTTSNDVANMPLTNDNFAFTKETNDNAYQTSRSYYDSHDLKKPKNLHPLSS
jgi:hypothetical protein